MQPSSSEICIHHFASRAWKNDDAYHKEMMMRKGLEDLVMIRLRHYKTTGRGWINEDEGWINKDEEEDDEEEDDEEDEEEEETTGGPRIVRGFRIEQRDIIAEKLVTVSLCCFKLIYSAERIVRDLTNLQVPEEEQPSIIAKVFRAIDELDVVPFQTIVVDIEDFTAHLRRRRPAAPSSISETKVQYIPATKSSIEGLEKVRLLDLQGLLKAAAAYNTTSLFCVICMEGFFNVDGQGHDHVDDDQRPLLARMPCKHLYHGDCIVQWLERSHLCPLCRYPMPTMPRYPMPTTRNALQMLIDNYTDDMDQD